MNVTEILLVDFYYLHMPCSLIFLVLFKFEWDVNPTSHFIMLLQVMQKIHIT